jgi:pimeloyl-ACP methyl ester carboxylesterase
VLHWGDVQEPRTIHVASEDGVEVAVHDYGGRGTTTLFVHGTGLVSRMWEPVIERLPPERFRALAVDLRAHGASRGPADVTFTDHRMVADLTAVCRVFEVAGGWAVAHSMGGGTALLTEADQPGTFSRLWVYEPIIFPRLEAGLGEGAEASVGVTDMVEASRRRRARFDSREQAAARYGARPPLDELAAAAMDAYVRHGFVDEAEGTVRLACDPESEARAFEQFLQDGYRRLPEISAPVLVAYGTASSDRSREWSPRIAEALPNGVAMPFEGSAHFGPFGRPEVAAAAIDEWFCGRAGQAPR